MHEFVLMSIFTNPNTYSWLLVIVLYIISFLGIVFPIIPGLLFIWLGFFAYHFLIDSEALGMFFWIMMFLFTIMLLGADFLINVYFVDRFGVSRASKCGAFFALLVGVFVYPPIGILLLPLVTVLIIELILKKTFKESLLVALGTLAGFLSSAAAKVLMQIVMIIIFFLFIIF